MVSWCFRQPLAYMLTMCRQSVYPAHDSQGSTNQSVYDTMCRAAQSAELHAAQAAEDAAQQASHRSVSPLAASSFVVMLLLCTLYCC